MTDGGIYVDDDGRESKRYDVVDGLGLTVWRRLGFTTAIITGRTGGTVVHRAAYLKIPHLVLACEEKGAALERLCEQTGIPLALTAFVGDDWPDLPALARAGYPIAVANAAPAVRARARFVTTRPGGAGAVREVVEHLLAARNMLDAALALYDGTHGIAKPGPAV